MLTTTKVVSAFPPADVTIECIKDRMVMSGIVDLVLAAALISGGQAPRTGRSA